MTFTQETSYRTWKIKNGISIGIESPSCLAGESEKRVLKIWCVIVGNLWIFTIWDIFITCIFSQLYSEGGIFQFDQSATNLNEDRAFLFLFFYLRTNYKYNIDWTIWKSLFSTLKWTVILLFLIFNDKRNTLVLVLTMQVRTTFKFDP